MIRGLQGASKSQTSQQMARSSPAERALIFAGETLRLRVCNNLTAHMQTTNGELDTTYGTHTQPMTVSSPSLVSICLTPTKQTPQMPKILRELCQYCTC